MPTGAAGGPSGRPRGPHPPTRVLEGGFWPSGSSASPRRRLSMSSRPWSDQERNFLATSWHQAWEAPRAAGGFRETAPRAQSSARTARPSRLPQRPWRPAGVPAEPKMYFILRRGVWGQPPSRLGVQPLGGGGVRTGWSRYQARPGHPQPRRRCPRCQSRQRHPLPRLAC